MKSKKSLITKLIAGGVVTAIVSYLIAKLISPNGLLQMLPYILFPICILIFFSKQIRHNFLEDKGTQIILFSQVVSIASLLIIFFIAPLPGVSRTMDFSKRIQIYLSLIGISFLISLVVRILIYYKPLHKENDMNQPLHG